MSSRGFTFTGVGRSMFRVTAWPTIMSVRDCWLASLVCTQPIYSPLRSTATRSDTSSTSWSLWVMMIRDLPSFFMLRMTANSLSVSWGVSTAVGSSRIRMLAPRYRTFTISTVCFWDTDMS